MPVVTRKIVRTALRMLMDPNGLLGNTRLVSCHISFILSSHHICAPRSYRRLACINPFSCDLMHTVPLAELGERIADTTKRLFNPILRTGIGEAERRPETESGAGYGHDVRGL